MASQVLFDRKWKIVLEVKNKVGTNLVTDETKTRVLKDLKVTFNIRNTLLGDPSMASFQIYNINSKTEALLTSHNCFITFYEGYATDNEASWNVLFTGKVTNSYDLRQNTDIIWNIWARDGFTLINGSRPTLASIQSPTAPKTILEDLVRNAVGLEGSPTYIGESETKLVSAPLLNEFMISGTFTEEFDDLLLPLGLGWKVEGSELIVFDQEKTDPSQIEGTPIPISDKTGLMTYPIADYTGITFTHLLNGKLKPTKIIDVVANTTRYNLGNEFYVENFDKEIWRSSGLFRIYEVVHRGDTRGSRWETDVTAFYRRN